MPNYNERKDFISALIDSSLLDNAIEWIAKNYYPEDVFPKEELEAWAINNGFAKDN